MNNLDLSLITKSDIPFIEATLTIHQPTLKEIALIGEQSFFTGCNFLNFSKAKFLSDKDNFNLTEQTNFDILMSIMLGKKQDKLVTIFQDTMMVLALLFPDYKIDLTPKAIVFTSEHGSGQLTNSNFEQFKQIIKTVFCLERANEDNVEYNPQSEMAKKIAAKLQKGREQAEKLKGESKENSTSILNRYISILTIGEHKDMNSFAQYTIYQLFDEFERFELKQDFDMYVQAKLAGAKDVKEVDNWMKNIH